MLQKIANRLWEIGSGKMVIVALVIYLLFAGIVMNMGASHISKLSGKPVRILDLNWGYSVDKTHEILGDYTPEALEFAALFNGTADMVYPWVYAFLFSMLFAWLGKSNKTGARYLHSYLPLLPLLIIIVDYVENILIINILLKSPKIGTKWIVTASFFTQLKWMLVIFIILLVFLLIVRKIYYKK